MTQHEWDKLLVLPPKEFAQTLMVRGYKPKQFAILVDTYNKQRKPDDPLGHDQTSRPALPPLPLPGFEV